jgi:putative two-component system response regulator
MHDVGQKPPAQLLVVDDEPIVRDLLSRWLRDDGYSCATASSAAAAWAHLQEHHVDLATLDITMPGGSGLDLLDQIRKTLPDTAAVMLTAEGDSAKAIRALTAGAYGYLIKPVERQELLIQVRNAIERRRLLIENREYMHELESKVREQTHSIRAAHEDTIHRLVTASMYRDEETGAHIRRVGMCSAVMAYALGWSYDEVELLRMAAPMHDIGKIGIPDVILQKPGTLTPEEFEIMKRHTLIGAEMLAGSESPVLELGRMIALSHHERWDGKGYPLGLAASNIPERARIVAIVDVYDALTHDRVYRPALSDDNAVGVIENGLGTHFDPCLLRLFLSLLPEMRRIGQETPDELTQAERLREMHPRLALDMRSSELMLQAT